MITTKDPGSGLSVTDDQYSVVMVRSYNYNKRLNLGNQARRLAWRLMNPQLEVKDLKCPVTVYDNHCKGDEAKTTTPSSCATGITFNVMLILLSCLLFALMHC